MGKPTTTKFIGTSLVSILLVLSMSLYGGFHLLIGLTLLVLIQGLLVSLCKKLLAIAQIDSEQRSYIFPLFQIVTVCLFTIAIYLMSQAAYTEKISYLYWLSHLFDKNLSIIEFEVATYIFVNYFFVTVVLYGKPLSKMLGDKIDRWLPPSWILIFSIILIVYTREGFNHFTRISSLMIGSGVLILVLFMRKAEGKMHHTRYIFEPGHYFITFTIMVLVLWGLGTNMPKVQELPGTRWLKNLRSNFGTQANLDNNLPASSELTKDLVLSDVILFEVDASEPIYLREVAYKKYINNAWELEVGDSSYESYIEFRPAYIEAEYSQTATILNEMAWLRTQKPELFSEYKQILNRESSITMKKRYTINQNPINKVNYFTINGFTGIQDSLASRIYYYGNLENIYFHSDRLVEPTWYQVSYYDRTPKQGSREYAFLKGLSHNRFINLYKELQAYREDGLYNIELIPKLLRTYTPLVQYQKVQQSYLQIPEEIEYPIYELTKEVIKGEVSDWGQAEAICNYLKENYIYNLQSKPAQQGDDVYDFLFNQKQGVCQEFASSMVLMCRSVGLPTRYVTGYLVTEKKPGTTNTYVVREKDAHAFAEVYIPAYGWMLFDPTPPIVQENLEPEKTKQMIAADYMQLGLGSLIFVLCIFLSFKFVHGVKTIYWLLLLHLKPTKWGIESLMRRTLFLLEKKGYPKEEKETISQYQKRMADEGFSIELVVSLFEKSTFGHQPPSREELKLAVKAYRGLGKKSKSI